MSCVYSLLVVSDAFSLKINMIFRVAFTVFFFTDIMALHIPIATSKTEEPH